MINLNNYPIFVRNLSTLKETSLDDEHPNCPYMTLSTRDAIDFDDVKTDYAKPLGLSTVPKSNDALFSEGNEYIVFVEFKNGVINRQTQFDIRKKIYDSILMFTDITSTKISYLREHLKFFLVYNETANINNKTDDELTLKANVQSSNSFDNIAKTFAKHAKKEYICFGLKMFENYCFKEVHTYTQSEFENYLSTL